MPLFRYKAVTPQGDSIEGTMEALSRDDVIGRLQEAGNLPLDAREADAAGLGAGIEQWFRRAPLSGQEMVSFTQQLATLMGAGQPLDRALQILIDLPDSERARKLIHQVREVVRGGTSLSAALEQQHGAFSRLYINMVRAGEVSGSLQATLKRLAEYMERSAQVRGSVINALVYPAILMAVVTLALGVMLTSVVPQFVPLFESLGQELPWYTKLVLGIGQFFAGWWWALLLALAALAWAGLRRLSDPASRKRLDARLLEWRLTAPLASRIETARLARTLGTLLTNGVPLLTAMSIARNVLDNRVLMEVVDEAGEDVKSGAGLAYALGKGKRFPRLALQMIAVGEESGELDAMLLKVADTFDIEVRNTIDRLMQALVPALVLVLAAVIGLIAISIVLPILQLAQTLGVQ
jgi:general secretion pathway protein F